MFNPTAIVASRFADYLSELYLAHFAGRRPEYAAYIGGAARLVLERIGSSDALYHNAEHTMMVTLAGQQIIRGQLLSKALQPEDWLHYTLALLVHDIGLVRGVCQGDTSAGCVIDREGTLVEPPRGASDAWLGPWHVDRGMIYTCERFMASDFIDADRVARAVDFTRFPVPTGGDYADTASEGALVRAADLIGQMGDPYYHRKINALFHEFVETGKAEELGYTSPSDLVEQYPEFFWSKVRPLIPEALGYLELTIEGRQWIANLYNNLFQSEHKQSFFGPFPGAS